MVRVRMGLQYVQNETGISKLSVLSDVSSIKQFGRSQIVGFDTGERECSISWRQPKHIMALHM
jgi:hypothetical protein